MLPHWWHSACRNILFKSRSKDIRCRNARLLYEKKKSLFFLLLSCKAQLRIIQCCYITSTRNTRSRLCFFHVHITQFSRFSSLLHLSLIFLFGAQTKKEKNEENIHFILFPVREKRRNRFCVEESASTKEIRRERERERQVLLHTRGDWT